MRVGYFVGAVKEGKELKCINEQKSLGERRRLAEVLEDLQTKFNASLP